MAAEHDLLRSAGSMTVNFEALDHPSPAGETANAAANVRLLAVRLVDAPIGDLPLDPARATPTGEPGTADATVNIQISGDLAGRVIPTGRITVAFHEWRLTAGARPARQIPWPAFPSVASTVADWIVHEAARHPDDVILLATRIPQELAVGLGIQIGLRTRHWPTRMFPVVFTRGVLVVPNLRLGSESVPTER